MGVPMKQMRFRAVAATAIVSGVFGLAACVDLFHSTDFDTLCSFDASACTTEDGGGSSKPDGSKSDAGAGAGDVDFCTKYTTKDARVAAAQHACVWLTNCLPSKQEGAYANCFAHALAAYDCDFNPFLRPRADGAAFWECLSNVGACSSVAQCVFGGDAPTCTGAGSFRQCDKSNKHAAVVECGSTTTPVSIETCTLAGQACVNVDQQTARCAGQGGAGPGCPSSPRCVGTSAVSCGAIDTVRSDQGIDCALVGSGKCVEEGLAVACAPGVDAPPCDSASAALTCADATTAEGCVDSATIRIDCSALGQVCNDANSRTLDPLSACTQKDGGALNACSGGVDTCDGTTKLQSCRGGTQFTVKCADVSGFSTCDDTQGPARCIHE